jgi:hypothetical protein
MEGINQKPKINVEKDLILVGSKSDLYKLGLYDVCNG